MTNPEKEPNNALKQVGIFTLIPMLFVSGPIIGYLLGNWIDQKWDTAPWGLTIFCILGFVAGTRQVINQLKIAIKESEED